MWKATIRGVVARKVRLMLTALAVVLGVAFLSGIYVLTDTVNRSFRSLFDSSLAHVDLVVQTHAPFGGETGRTRFDESTLDRTRSVPGVAASYGFVEGYAQFVTRDGTAIQHGGFPTIGVSWSQRGSAGPLRLV